MYLAISDINRSYTHNLEDQATQAGSITYHYNDDDFLSKKVDGTETTLYDYSSMGELKSVTLPGGMVVTYTHDVLTRPVAKSIDGSIVEKYLWNGRTQLLAVLKPDNSIHQRFIYADDRLPYAMTQDNQIFYMAYDQVGSLRVVTDGSGNVVKEVRYDTFGNIVSDSNPSFAVPFGFAGGLHDIDTGLVRFGYRDYAPEIGRWTAKDPIGFAGGDTNLYGYVLNDPANLIDPDGLEAATLGAILGAILRQMAIDAAMGAGLEIFEQLLDNGFRAECIDWENVGWAAGFGAIPIGGKISNAMQALKIGGKISSRGIDIFLKVRARIQGIGMSKAGSRIKENRDRGKGNNENCGCE